MIWVCLVMALVSFAICVPLTWAVIGVGRRLGQMDVPDGEGGRKAHKRAVPNTGGVAIFWSVVLPMGAAMGAVWAMPVEFWRGWLEPVRMHVEGLRAQTPLALGVLAALAVVHLMGLIDDRKRLGPFSKLIVQVGVAGALVWLLNLRILEFMGQWYGVAGVVLSIAASVLWIVTITNAMNFLDNMDGLSGGVGAIIAGLYLAATLVNGQWFVAALAALLLGALLGFLVFNFPPAKVFMGDGGSLVLGLLLAVISIRTTYFDSHEVTPLVIDGLPPAGRWYGLFMPVVILAVPLYDFASVTLIRISQGKSPFYPDRQHFSHRLVAKGLSERSAVLVIWLCTLATGLGGVVLGRVEAGVAAVVMAQTAAVVAVLGVMERSWTGRDLAADERR